MAAGCDFDSGRLPLTLHYALGAAAAPAALAATALGTAAGRGGTLIAVARRQRAR